MSERRVPRTDFADRVEGDDVHHGRALVALPPMLTATESKALLAELRGDCVGSLDDAPCAPPAPSPLATAALAELAWLVDYVLRVGGYHPPAVIARPRETRRLLTTLAPVTREAASG